MGSFSAETTNAYLIQRCDAGFMIRQFLVDKHYYRGNYLEPHIFCREIRRAIYSENAKPVSAYYWGFYKQQYSRWIRGGTCSARNYGWDKGKVYGKTLPDLFRHELKQTGLQFFLKKNPITDPERFLAYINQVPRLEQMMKAGLDVLVKECFQDCSPYVNLFYGCKETSLIGALGIDNARMKRLRSSGKGLLYLKWLRYEKQTGISLDDDLILWFCQKNLAPKDLDFVSSHMSYQQIRNYIQHQMDASGKDFHWVMNTWKDYITMAKRLDLNLDEPYFCRPSRLHARHQKLVVEINKVDEELRAKEFGKTYPTVEKTYAEIQPIYSYVGENYCIKVPMSILEILKEGRHLNHCIGTNTRYLERIERKESYLLFLRRNEKPEESYYTLEVEPDGTVRQKRTLNDEQLDDIEQAKDFLREWQAEVSKRLTSTERNLAIRSKALREQEFLDLKKNNVVIYTGALRGQRLLDVLLADLMENEEAVPALAVAA